jgi:hypothetical protein
MMEHGEAHRRFLRGLGVAGLATALFAAWLGWGIGGETSVRYFSDLATPLAALTAAALCLQAGRRHAGALRRFWWLLAAAAGAWTIAEVIWGVYDLVLVEEVPVPSWADVGYLGGIPLAVGALLSHPALRGGGVQKARSVFDGLVIATALLFLSWTLVLGPLWRSTDLTTLGGIVALAYPFGDVVIVFFIVLAVRGMTGGDRLALWCLLGGLLAMALADSSYAYLAETGSYDTGNLIDAGWFVGYLGIALCAFSSDARVVAARRADSPRTLASLVAPFLPVLVALIVPVIESGRGHHLDDAAWIMAFSLVALVLARQGLLVVDLLAPSGEREADLGERLAHAALGGEIREAVAADSSRLPSPGRSPP